MEDVAERYIENFANQKVLDLQYLYWLAPMLASAIVPKQTLM